MIATYAVWITYETRCGAAGCPTVHLQRFVLPPYNDLPRAVPPKGWHVLDSVPYCPQHRVVVDPPAIFEIERNPRSITDGIEDRREAYRIDARASWSER